ncbi:MAG: thioredoxin-disulfide reductase [Firmicutes bacterium]|uniref:Thioredoxin reductase n=1 Tax=Candidatus Scybalomonas excrementavium TaxID=2840943 RepID=A0A9D9N7J9_9FIRM|nr:thioredoxin-disulfide reductase [Candidatus Scybalomonas excrementavium]
MSNKYDLTIIGSGPAGLTAAIYAQRALLKTIVIEKNPMSGGQILNTYEVDNYPGIPMVNGFDLGLKMREHADKLGTEFKIATVQKVEQIEDGFRTVFQNGEAVESKTVILATGAECVTLNVEGEERLKGMGVSYCATCDGAFFRGKTVAVVGGGDVALEDALFLARGCEKVYLIHRRDTFRGAKILQQQVLATENIEVLWDTVTEEIHGDTTVSSLKLKNVKTKEEQELQVNGVFIAIGNRPDTEMVADIVKRDEKGYIIGDETGTTSTPGFFVAGDVRTKALRQVVTAASDGANAVYAVEKYLSEQI